MPNNHDAILLIAVAAWQLFFFLAMHFKRKCYRLEEELKQLRTNFITQ